MDPAGNSRWCLGINLINITMTGAKRTSGRNNGKGNGTGTANADKAADKQPGPLLALVKWTSGADAGNYTTNCPASWIKNFDPSQPWARDEEMAIEWLRPPKPSRGWPVYDGFVYDVSSEYSNHQISNTVFLSVVLSNLSLPPQGIVHILRNAI